MNLALKQKISRRRKTLTVGNLFFASAYPMAWVVTLSIQSEKMKRHGCYKL